ncbi:MAG: chemotaxis response regulator protein-glutamate methylesterase [bacterium]
MSDKIKVLVVDDSAFMRKALSKMLSSDASIEVIDTATNGKEAIDKINKLHPDVVTLDVEMPYMDGLTALKHIMKESPLPVLMVSSVTEEGAKITLEALELGAVDFIPKELSLASLDIFKVEKQLVEKVKAISKVTVNRSALKKNTLSPKIKILSEKSRVEVIAIGTSTGGPAAIQEILTKLPADLPASILIVQHMPATFTATFAKRLNELCTLEVNEAQGGEELAHGAVYIAPGGKQMTIARMSKKIIIKISDRPYDLIYKPSADVMMTSVAKEFGNNCAGIILTGMGSDGLEGITAIHKNKGKTIAESEESCIVYGMPRVAIEANVIDIIVPLQQVAGEIINLFQN